MRKIVKISKCGNSKKDRLWWIIQALKLFEDKWAVSVPLKLTIRFKFLLKMPSLNKYLILPLHINELVVKISNLSGRLLLNPSFLHLKLNEAQSSV